jgi:hypothetical protein
MCVSLDLFSVLDLCDGDDLPRRRDCVSWQLFTTITLLALGNSDDLPRRRVCVSWQ